jgi:hypothetical protein
MPTRKQSPEANRPPKRKLTAPTLIAADHVPRSALLASIALSYPIRVSIDFRQPSFTILGRNLAQCGHRDASDRNAKRFNGPRDA